MRDQRLADKSYKMDPGNVKSLDPDHPAIIENRTLFPNTVVPVTMDEPTRLLVSGFNNKKIGKIVQKGRFKGYHLYNFSLEERATCPEHCEARAFCYGNGMHLARRHQIDDFTVFSRRMYLELAELMRGAPGLLVRLHVLGDFPSVQYVHFWVQMLSIFPKLVVWGYTHWDMDEPEGADIALVIAAAKLFDPDRFRVRWSGVHGDDGTVISEDIPEGKHIGDAIVCPAQTEASECCATCGLCWETRHTIAFIKHGPKKAKGAS